MHPTYNWDNTYDREKYGYNDQEDNQLRAELEKKASSMRRDIGNSRIGVYVNKHLQIIVELNLNDIESMFSVMNAMEELNNIRIKYLLDFESANFEICMERDKPTIYCSYERI
jgi:hypothetical protein